MMKTPSTTTTADEFAAVVKAALRETVCELWPDMKPRQQAARVRRLYTSLSLNEAVLMFREAKQS